jgi:hypothetical protein
MPRGQFPVVRRLAALAVAAAILASGLTACTSGAPATVPSPTPTESVPADPALKSQFPSSFTAETAQVESLRLADTIDALLPKNIVLNVAHTAQLVPATTGAGSYFGVLQHITINPTVDPVLVAKSIAQKLVASGWSQLQAQDQDGVHLVNLSSGSNVKTSWFLVLSGDPRVTNQSVVSLQLASPDLP